MLPAAEFNQALIAKYDRTGPRYTSYPTAPQFSPTFGPEQYQHAAKISNQSGAPLSLYVHVPFCKSLCYYCGCHKIVTHKSARAEQYLQYLKREIALQAALFSPERSVSQLHLGGGTPTYFTLEQLADLMGALKRAFRFVADGTGEFSIEVDPRTVDPQGIHALKGLGFNRLSFGIQDFNLEVQQAVNRVQSVEQTQALMSAARDAGFKSVSVDLIYGLPLQTAERFKYTLEQVIALRPERIATYSYAHMPQHIRAQRLIKREDMPPPERKLELLQLTIETLTKAGYVYIGMDHFALPNDELCAARAQGTLQRNFQGYSTHAHCELIGLGVSSIGQIAGTYSQNAKDLKSYYAALDKLQLAVVRGYQLSVDDQLRRELISAIMCHGRVDFNALEQRYGIDCSSYFANELAELKRFAQDDL